MGRESKISVAILVLGFVGIALYWFTGSTGVKGYKVEDERIVLPHESAAFYHKLPKVKAYLDAVQKQIEAGQAVLPLEERELDEQAKVVQDFLLQEKHFLSDTVSSNGALQHNDMMTIRPAITSAMAERTALLCKSTTCYQALKYNFVTNTTTRAIVDVKGKKLLELRRFPEMQPDVSLRLREVSQEIALNAPEVAQELGKNPSIKDMSMANVRGSLNGSPCDNANHLCVAPTFSYHDKEEALWAIVDLTDLKLAAAKWAGLGKTATPSCISERSLQNREIMEKYCQQDTLYREGEWMLSYRITGSDGLEIVDASFKGKKVLKSAKIVDWHVAYKSKSGASALDTSTDTYAAGRHIEYIKGEDDAFFFGYNDAMGCPMFSTSVVLPFNAPQIKPLMQEGKKVGFFLTQDYRNPKWPMACNYRYENRFEFYNDGSFRVVGVNIGRGCGENAVYRPVMRIDMALSRKEHFFKYDGDWKVWLVEGEDFQGEATAYFEDKFLYKIEEQGGRGYYIEPNRGQFNDGSRGDNARLFTTRYKEGEGEQDLLTLGSCCKLDEDGVERYLEGKESIDGEDIVIWYVPKIKNDAREGHEYCWADTVIGDDGNVEVRTFPCVVGPKFVPISR